MTTAKSKTTLSKTSSSSNSILDKPIPGLNTTTAIVVWLILTTLLPLTMWTTTPNRLGMSILFFNNLNILIALCEIALGNHINFIKQDFEQLKIKYHGHEWQAGKGYLLYPFTIRTLFDGRTWAQMWSTYSLWDPSYSNSESFGFFIDVGNGWSTIAPCLLWNVTIVFPEWIQDNQLTTLVGFVGACSYWQVLYGTIVYLLSFLWNKRYIGKPLAEVLGFVGVTNGIWFFFPIAALYASYQILLTKDCTDIFRP